MRGDAALTSALLPLQVAVQYMQREHGADLAATLNQCVSERGSLIVFRGGPLTWCPAPPAPAPP